RRRTRVDCWRDGGRRACRRGRVDTRPASPSGVRGDAAARLGGPAGVSGGAVLRALTSTSALVVLRPAVTSLPPNRATPYLARLASRAEWVFPRHRGFLSGLWVDMPALAWRALRAVGAWRAGGRRSAAGGGGVVAVCFAAGAARRFMH